MEKPERNPDFQHKCDSFWFDEMIMSCTISLFACEFKITDRVLIKWGNDYINAYSNELEIQKSIIQAYYNWMNKKILGEE